MSKLFWQTLERLPTEHKIIIDRPRGRAHPKYPELVYPLDYGYLEGTLAADGDGIDAWLGSEGTLKLAGILCTYDPGEQDAEIKLLLGCTPEDIQTILEFNSGAMQYLFVPKPREFV